MDKSRGAHDCCRLAPAVDSHSRLESHAPSHDREKTESNVVRVFKCGQTSVTVLTRDTVTECDVILRQSCIYTLRRVTARVHTAQYGT